MNWNYFEKYEAINEKYLPLMGEGTSKASQIVTAVNKLIYKWYNDGDVYDNRYWLEGWCNDLSSYANWLRENANAYYLDRIDEAYTGEDYEAILADLADALLDEEFLKTQAILSTVGTIYDYDGPFKFVEVQDEDY